MKKELNFKKFMTKYIIKIKYNVYDGTVMFNQKMEKKQ